MNNNGMTPLSGSVLKIIAVVAMLIDHVAAYLLIRIPSCTEPLFVFQNEPVSMVSLMRTVGRVAFPIFCFLLVEGFTHTRNRYKYGLYLLLFALLSEIPFDLVETNTLNPYRQNIFFSLGFGYIGIWICSLKTQDCFNKAMMLTMLGVVVLYMRGDYGLGGFLFILSIYGLRNNLIMKMCSAVLVLPNPMGVSLATLPIGLYNGKRGFIQGEFFKLGFYAFYPVHLAVIFCIRNLCLI